jgi:probable O-glycosylation ligase (exosortase A-associated)
MRDYVFVPLIIALCGVALRHPWVGALAWTWLSIMNPHAYTWAAATMPVAAMVAGSTLLGALITRDRRRIVVTAESSTLALFMLWITFTLPFALMPEGSYDMWVKIMKIDLMILVTLVLLQSKRQIELFVWVIVVSLGFYGVKGGIFTIVTGGSHLVLGPGGFISGNNEIALALIMVIPLMRFLQLETSKPHMKLAWSGAMLLTAAAALGSHSRGALLAIGAMSVYLWIKSPRKLVFGIGLVLGGTILLGLMTSQWETRMETIVNYEQDQSAMGRINAWWMAWNLAKDNILGGGFDIYNARIFARYAPDPKDVHAAHSIYFQVLGEQGFVGLTLFVLMWWFVWRSASWLVREGARAEETHWCRNLGAMCQVSLVGYAVGGAFLSLAYFDLPYNVLAVVVLAKRWLQDHRASVSVDPTRTASNAPNQMVPAGHSP